MNIPTGLKYTESNEWIKVEGKIGTVGITDFAQDQLSDIVFAEVIVAEGGWGMSPTFGFEMSFNVILEKATLVYDCTRSPAFRVCPREGQAFTPEVAAGDGYSREVEHFVKTLRGESVPQVLTLEQSRDSVRLVQAELPVDPGGLQQP